jgi:hypothetical protein
MSRKDYVAFARLVNMLRAEGELSLNGAVAMAVGMADVFAGDNPRFDRGRFLAACDLTPRLVAS